MGESPIGLLSTTVKPQQGSPTDLDLAREQLQSGENTDRPPKGKKGKSSNFGQKKVAQNNNAGLFGTSQKPTPTPIPLGTTISLGGPQNDQVRGRTKMTSVSFLTRILSAFEE